MVSKVGILQSLKTMYNVFQLGIKKDQNDRQGDVMTTSMDIRHVITYHASLHTCITDMSVIMVLASQSGLRTMEITYLVPASFWLEVAEEDGTPHMKIVMKYAIAKNKGTGFYTSI